MKEVLIKEGMPTVDTAQKRLQEEIVIARRQGVKALKIIHGYGSSGEGGALRAALRRTLSQRKREGRIKAFVAGEKFTIFEEEARTLLDGCPELSRDSDLNRSNAGITLVLL